MDSPVSIGVIVPVLDEEAVLERLLERVAPCEGDADRADDLVVVDGGSRDGSVELATARGARILHAPAGRGRQLSAGASACFTQVYLFLHADCVPEPGAVAAVRRAFEGGGCSAAALEQHIEAEGRFYRMVERSAGLRVRLLGQVLGDSALAVRRDVYLKAGGFRPLDVLEDVDLSRRLRRLARPRLLQGVRVSVSPRRWQEEGALRTTLRNWIIQAAFALGADPAALARHYPPHARGDRSP